jgi:hypothetical protein
MHIIELAADSESTEGTDPCDAIGLATRTTPGRYRGPLN